MIYAAWLRLSLGLGLSLVIWLTSFFISPIATALASSQQTPIEIQVQIGTTADELKFVPAQLSFKAGQRYTLKLSNPSAQKHYFTAKDFADSIWSQKVDAGNVEIKGAIHELELRPGTEADWVFIPLKPGSYELRCSIPGHSEAGMKGTLTIEG